MSDSSQAADLAAGSSPAATTATPSGLVGALSPVPSPSERDRFAVCLPYILKEEGGNDDDPHDPGGRTSRGILQREYNAYRQGLGESARDVWTATDTEVADIYYKQYWLPWCPTMAPGVDLVFFDADVNTGAVRAAKTLQRALGVADDGHIGIITSAALKNSNPIKLVAAISDQRRAFYRSLSTFKYFGRGWMNRVGQIEQVALNMAVPAGTVAV